MTMERIKKVNTKLKVITSNGVYNGNQSNRSSLQIKWGSPSPKKTAVAIGINPSKANDNCSDKTITTLSRFLDAYGFTELTMLNLFQSYSTTQSGIDTSSTTDFNKYQMLFSQTDAIIIVWGMGNEYTTEKSKALKVLKKYERKLFCIKKDEKYQLHHSRIHYNCSSLVKCSVGNTIIS